MRFAPRHATWKQHGVINDKATWCLNESSTGVRVGAGPLSLDLGVLSKRPAPGHQAVLSSIHHSTAG